MNIKKSLMVAGAVATIGVAGVMGPGLASAATNSSGPSDGLIDKIATKFNLNKNDVEAVFEEEKTEREVERQQDVGERLTELVAEGKLTEDQKSKILAKQAELKAQMEEERETLKDKTQEERRAVIEQRREDLKAWAEEHNIPTEYLRFVMGFHVHGGGEKPFMIKSEKSNDSANL